MKLNRYALALTIAAGSLAACGGDDASTAAESAVTAAKAATASADTAAASAAATGTKVNANTASEAELMTIPGVGEKIADEIAEYRPYDAATGETKLRKELAKYIAENEIDKIIPYLEFS